MVERYRSIIEGAGGQVHRYEDWGRRQLAYSINRVHKAHYVLLNVECDGDTREELVNAFRFNDAVLRHMVLARNEAVTEPSTLAKKDDKRDDKKSARQSQPDEEVQAEASE
jgi:small subunit ribosomal protein S6